ncbi:hypothetical protein [Marivita geojedonensis]|uniref:Lipoprotein n=1 Tax=Marivita geojedonensis TaxID=1123756 RepID=A0A1X4NLZ5_9RHOB|nr:hypothetical protein [Marivita geojedonensis]OSQ51351.1 hypothetical protein MGEO_07685 [Marivita geojedonensis]PRY77999.1 hypothetical protein CLV76_107186 [Marivita geojedonensis]
MGRLADLTRRLSSRRGIASLTGALGAAVVVSGCVFDKLKTQDYAGFETYKFWQTPGLGFCSDPEQVFSAGLTRGLEGGMRFSHSNLVLVSDDPSQCDNGISGELGCYEPEAQPDRQLTRQEATRVSEVFAKVDYFKRPDPICKDLAIDPCVIERHAWDGDEYSDYLCGADRLSDDESSEIHKLLSDLKSGS